jgi:16S rRNA processing protein RimM
VGRVAGSYGVRGWIRIERPQEALAQCGRWWIGGREYPVAETKWHSGALLAKLEGVETREAALELKGTAVAVQRDAMPDPAEGTYYLADLVGLEVVNEKGAVLGRVEKFFSSGSQDVMEVVGDKTRLLPWVAAVVKDVDLAGGRVRVEWEADW